MEEEFPEPQLGHQKKVNKNTFQKFGFCYELYKALVYKGFRNALPIQKKAIPIIMEGRDAIISSRTGSGKTLAYVLPMINRLKCHSQIIGARSLILIPTRELALQVASVLKDFTKFTDIRYVLLLGGHSYEGQFEGLATNPDIIIATPGRLMQLLVETDFKLSRVEMVIFDEADSLF
jgi:ATP-dependent RNA helicase DDX54/DBP10